MRFLLVFLLIVLIWLQYELWVGKGSLTEVRELKAAIKLQQDENELLKERNEALAAEVKDLKSGMEAIEELARSEMGMIKKDEQFYQIVDPNPSSTPQVKQSSKEQPE